METVGFYMSNKEVYPITYTFEEFLVEKGLLQIVDAQYPGHIKVQWLEDRGQDGSRLDSTVKIAATMHEGLGEYEHGFNLNELQELFGDLGKCEIDEMDAAEVDEETKILRARRLNAIKATYEDLILMHLP